VIYSLLWMRTVDEAARPLLARWRPEDFLRRNRAGRIIAPAGGLRDFFLHVHPEAVPACVDFLAERLEGIAEVVTLQHLVNRGLFGESPSPIASGETPATWSSYPATTRGSGGRSRDDSAPESRVTTVAPARLNRKSRSSR